MKIKFTYEVSVGDRVMKKTVDGDLSDLLKSQYVPEMSRFDMTKECVRAIFAGMVDDVSGDE